MRIAGSLVHIGILSFAVNRLLGPSFAFSLRAASTSTMTKRPPVSTTTSPRSTSQVSTNTIDALIVRHGETFHNKEGRIQGNSDVSRLTQNGRAQAEEVGKAIAKEGRKIDRIFLSPLARARHTFDIMEEQWRHLGYRDYPTCAPTFLPDLQEIALYHWQGQLKSDLKVQEAEAYKNWYSNPTIFQLGDRFPVRDLWTRARNAWQIILATAQPGENILIVAHSGINQALVLAALGYGEEMYRGIPFPNCGSLHLRLRLPSNPEQLPEMTRKGGYTLPIDVCLCKKTQKEVDTHYRTVHPSDWEPDVHYPKADLVEQR